MKNLFIYILLSLIFLGCTTKSEELGVRSEELGVRSEEFAENFRIEKDSAYTTISIFSPWEENKVLYTYYLVKNDSIKVPSDGIRIKVPLQSIAINSCSHVAYIDALGGIEKIVASSDPAFVYNENFRKKLAEGSIKNLGGSYDMNFEQILREKPEVLMVTGFNGVDKTALRVQETGIPVVYNYEWVEKSVLGRAEWVKFFGELFDCREKADSIFNEIKTEYIKCAEMASKVTNKPTVLSGTPYKGTWYIPGGQTFMAEFFRNSGMDYFYSDNKDNFSLALSLETVMANFLDADIWVGVDVKTYDRLAAQDERLMLFKQIKNKKVYHHLNRTTDTGGNDFWESAMLRPDILLKDFIKIAHPELLPEWELYYLGEVEGVRS